MIVKATVIGEDGFAVEKPQMPGDILDSCDPTGPFVVDETAGGVTLTQAQFAQSFPALEVSGNAGAVATTLPTADQIVAALKGNVNVIVPPTVSAYDGGHEVAPPMQWPSNLGTIPPQTTVRWIVRNLNVGINTITAQANSGVTVLGTATIATVTWREYILRILCSAPSVIVGMTTLNASKVLTLGDLEAVKRVQVGQSAYGVGIGALAVVVAVDYNLGNVTVSVASTASAPNIAVTFTPTVTFTNLRAGAT